MGYTERENWMGRHYSTDRGSEYAAVEAVVGQAIKNAFDLRGRQMCDDDKRIFYDADRYPRLLEDATMVVMEAMKYDEDLPRWYMDEMIRAQLPGGRRTRDEVKAMASFVDELIGQLRTARERHADLVRQIHRFEGDRRSEWTGYEWDEKEPIYIQE